MWIHSHSPKHENSRDSYAKMARFTLHNSPAWLIWHGDYATHNIEVVTASAEWTWSNWISSAVPPRVVGLTLFRWLRQGRRNSGRAEGAVKKLRAVETYKKQTKIVTNMLISVQQQCWPQK